MSTIEDQLKTAKARLNRAAARCLENDEGAAIEADQALAEVAALQAVLKASKGRPCPECGRWTLHDRCDRHRVPEPAGIWAESARLRGEMQGGER